MNKEDFLVILQSALFSFDKMDEEKIITLMPDKKINLIKTGIKLNQYLEKQ